VDLQPLADDLHRRFDDKMAARERALPAARRVIRSSANAIRAIHRGDFDQADRLLEDAAGQLREGLSAVREHPDVRYAGFLHDAEKEYAEARLTEAVIGEKDLPSAEELDVTPSAYLNGMAETIGEARRAVLDRLRQGDLDRSEELLGRMEDMYHVLVTIDYPDAITGNLRRSTDVARGILEKTRGDLSISIVLRRLHDALDRHAHDVLGDQG
jgi:translin